MGESGTGMQAPNNKDYGRNRLVQFRDSVTQRLVAGIKGGDSRPKNCRRVHKQEKSQRAPSQ
jgi:hypothetical protein